MLTYASDLTLLGSVLARHEPKVTAAVRMASLDHAVWFHRPFRADDWLLYEVYSPVASGSRGLATGGGGGGGGGAPRAGSTPAMARWW